MQRKRWFTTKTQETFLSRPTRHVGEQPVCSHGDGEPKQSWCSCGPEAAGHARVDQHLPALFWHVHHIQKIGYNTHVMLHILQHVNVPSTKSLLLKGKGFNCLPLWILQLFFHIVFKDYPKKATEVLSFTSTTWNVGHFYWLYWYVHPSAPFSSQI